MNFVQAAIDRVEHNLRQYDSDQPAEILADIIHYCRVKGIDLDSELRFAEQYADEELICQLEYNEENV